MTHRVKAIPDGYHSVTPYLAVDDAASALTFYQRALGARERLRLPTPNGRVAHAEIDVSGSCIMLADACPEMGFRSPKTIGGTPVTLHLYVEDVDAVVQQAVASGAREVRPVQDQFYGDRSGTIEDPFGHLWHVATHKEDLSPEDLQRRLDAAMQGDSGCSE